MTDNTPLFWVLEASVMASLLTLAVIAIRSPLTRFIGARGVVFLWSIPALRLIMPPLPKFAAATSTHVVTTDMAPAVMYTDQIAAFTALPAAQVVPLAATPNYMTMTGDILGFTLLSAWAVGMVYFLVKTLFETTTWHNAVHREAIALPQGITAMAEQCASRLGLKKAPQIVMSKAADTPQLIGLRRPIVVLPQDFCERYTPYEQQLAMLHELTHQKRGDLISAWIAMILWASQWFNPLAHRALALFRIDQEAACDEGVRAYGVGTKDYAATLVKAAALTITPATALTLNHGLSQRLKRLSNPLPKQSIARSSMVLVALMAITGATATASGFSVPAPQDTDDQDTDETKIAPTEQRALLLYTGDDQNPTTLTIETDELIMRGDNSFAFVTGDNDDENDFHLFRSGPRTIHIGGQHMTGFYLLSDPFADLLPPPTPPMVRFEMDMPAPPAPPAMPAPPAPEKVEGGTWMFVPDAPDMREFEKSMRVFELKMGDFEETMTVDMKGFEADMEGFSARMEKASETISTLAEQCKEKQKRKGSPVILKTRASEGNGVVKAICIRDEDMADEDIIAYVKNLRSLSDEEKDRFTKDFQNQDQQSIRSITRLKFRDEIRAQGQEGTRSRVQGALFRSRDAASDARRQSTLSELTKAREEARLILEKAQEDARKIREDALADARKAQEEERN